MKPIVKQGIPHGIMFHHFHNEKHPRVQGSITAGRFEELLQFVGIERILSAKDFLNLFQKNRLEKGHICLTFDDALLCQYEIALPVLKKYNIKAFWFIYSSVFEGNHEYLEIHRYFRNTNFNSIKEFYKEFFKTAKKSKYSDKIEKGLKKYSPETYLKECPFYMKEDKLFRFIRDQILIKEEYDDLMFKLMEDYNFDLNLVVKKLWMRNEHLKDLDAKGHIVGLHSYSHSLKINDLPKHIQEKEYRKNFQHLHNLLGKKPIVMSHPNNSYNRSVMAILRELGITMGFVASMKPIENRSSLEIAREDHANILAKMKYEDNNIHK